VNVPEDLRYTSDHEWVRRERDDRLVVGVTDLAQTSLSDVVYLELPKVGTSAAAKEAVAGIESVKSTSELYVPVGGSITEVNELLKTSPELVNTDPYGAGWIFVLAPSSPVAFDELLTPDAYSKLTAEPE
jgi:glycine cleavage system H protein